VCPGPFDDGWLGWRGFGAEGAFKFGGAGGELSDLRAQRGEAFAGGFFGHGAVLERREVPVDRRLFLPDLGEQGGVFGAAVGLAVAALLLGAGDGVGDEAGGVGVGVAKCLEDGGVEASVERRSAWQPWVP
jgi:hypothetical protein